MGQFSELLIVNTKMTADERETEQQPVSGVTETFQEHIDESDDNSLDMILVRIGEFGRYQMFNYVLLCIPMIFNAFQSISYVFSASPVVYR